MRAWWQVIRKKKPRLFFLVLLNFRKAVSGNWVCRPDVDFFCTTMKCTTWLGDGCISVTRSLREFVICRLCYVCVNMCECSRVPPRQFYVYVVSYVGICARRGPTKDDLCDLSWRALWSVLDGATGPCHSERSRPYTAKSKVGNTSKLCSCGEC